MREATARALGWLRRPSPRRRSWLGAVAGVVLGVWLAGSVAAPIGPFDTTASVRPGLSGETTVRLGPLGSIELDTHDTPVSVELRVRDLRVADAERIARNPALLEDIGDEIAADARRALRSLALRVLLAALGGGVVGALAMSGGWWRSLRRGGTVALALVVTVGGATAVSFDADAVAEPRYTGLMTVAPTAVGDAGVIIDRFGQYRAQLTDLVTNVVTLYRAAERLPTAAPDAQAIRVLHVSDIHLNPQAFDLITLLVEQFHVDVVVDSGDITDWGSEPERRALTPIGRVGVPYVWVRGNHDSLTTQRAVARNRNAVVLDGGYADVAGLRFWGAGDPRYTPDKGQPVGKDVERQQIEEFAQRLPGMVTGTPDVLVVHDPRAAAAITTEVPVVLAGHAHRAEQRRAGEATVLVEGSTGGAGLRGLQGDYPHPLTATVLYFERTTRRLVAYDRITVRGLGETGATVERHLVAPEEPSAAE